MTIFFIINDYNVNTIFIFKIFGYYMKRRSDVALGFLTIHYTTDDYELFFYTVQHIKTIIIISFKCTENFLFSTFQ